MMITVASLKMHAKNMTFSNSKVVTEEQCPRYRFEKGKGYSYMVHRSFIHNRGIARSPEGSRFNKCLSPILTNSLKGHAQLGMRVANLEIF